MKKITQFVFIMTLVSATNSYPMMTVIKEVVKRTINFPGKISRQYPKSIGFVQDFVIGAAVVDPLALLLPFIPAALLYKAVNVVFVDSSAHKEARLIKQEESRLLFQKGLTESRIDSSNDRDTDDARRRLNYLDKKLQKLEQRKEQRREAITSRMLPKTSVESLEKQESSGLGYE